MARQNANFEKIAFTVVHKCLFIVMYGILICLNVKSAQY